MVSSIFLKTVPVLSAATAAGEVFLKMPKMDTMRDTGPDSSTAAKTARDAKAKARPRMVNNQPSDDSQCKL